MHYINIWRNTLYICSLLLTLQLTVQAQETAPSSPSTNPSSGTIETPAGPVTNSKAAEYYNRAKSSGMSDTDIEKAARDRGFTTDQILNVKKQILNLPNEQPSVDPNRDEIDDSREDKLDEETNNDRDSLSGRRKQDLRIQNTFGQSFFSSSSMTFQPNLRMATPKNYILGPDDELIVDIYGNSVDNFRMKVNPEGSVKMLNLAPVYVNGLTIEQANEKIINRLRQAYSGLNRPGSGTYSSITLGDVRSIQVLITGEAMRPGTYTVSSLATAFNALYASGGPNVNGSYRDIEVIRNGKMIRKMDLYKFLIDADLSDNIALRDQDIILIRPYQNRIELKGEIKKKGLYEAKENETIKDILRYAGGFTPTAYKNLITYQRNTGISYLAGSLDSSMIANFHPQNGDIFTIKKILEVVTNEVEIRGAVTAPGIFPLEERNNTVLELIEMAQGLGQKAFLNRAVLERVNGDSQIGIVAIDLRKLINGEIPDIELLPGDVLTIKSTEDLRQFTYLTIQGEIMNPGPYYYYKDITVSDLIFQAGGYSEGGIPYRIEVSRRVKGDTLDLPANQNIRIFTLNIADNLVLNEEDQQFKLSPYDIINIRKSPRYEYQKTITVLGQVMYPGNYSIINNFERITDLLPKAGGLKPEAYLQGARFFRRGQPVAVDLKSILEKPSSPANLLLTNGDTLYIPVKSELVSISGGVYNPSIVNFDPNFSFKDYISQAGGFSERARKKRVFISHPNGRTHRTTHFLFFRTYPKVQPGSHITIPEKEPKLEQPMSRGERFALFSLITTIAITAIRLF
ncbi:protein involved in polysaccharide export with SLBB domain [Dyadobacter jejuensis]|uniref:Protein involved in polysaccharide export with SLBB domain n=1 Tax=Dyadobacter jejuensis TaxID=1082580 RepID=A0A316AS26_9BACT|nr:SLBB domain-containing protein [Dyadobacter jejuensis]PWJ60402.1 protein involved in polysaccharide export with SLBB domain [Dyadobacter jejuensis]